MESVIPQLIILIILLFLSGFFSSAETALTTVSAVRVRTMAAEGDKRAAQVERVISDPGNMLSAILIGNNIVNISASSLATALAISLVGSVGAGIATGILTILVLIFGEITPKNSARIHALDISLRSALVIWILMKVLHPVIIFVNAISRGVMRLMGNSPDEVAMGMTPKEIQTLVDDSHEKGAIEEDEKDYIHNIFDFSTSVVKKIMIPRIDMSMADVNWSYDQLMEEFSRDMYTRIPVYEEDSDHIIGILNMKDLLLLEDKSEFKIRSHIREAFFTYEQKNISDLFEDMRENSISIAIVLDEYGAVAGMVTLEDLLEELVGEIRDEYDMDEEEPIVEIRENEYLVAGSVNLDDLRDQLGLEFVSEDYDTIGGYLTGEFNHFPKPGETFVTEDAVILKVAAVNGHRIEKVIVRMTNVKKED
ncbi:MAG: hemolysin family protein [Lachnospiraceae bacterium]|nr:hemolysin family protein [Lachnospiraceae bacterium]